MNWRRTIWLFWLRSFISPGSRLRSGFACLFYGSPGTGKTETVYQLARDTGRDLIVADISKLKSCWVGESEKNVKDLFRKYKRCVRESKTTPILLFNEADAIFGIRKSGADKAVEKMENSIQNIILQEMEDLEGRDRFVERFMCVQK